MLTTAARALPACRAPTRRHRPPHAAMAALPALPPAALRGLLARHRVILGSKSASRQTLLRELGVPYEVVVADIDEKAIRRDVPEELVMELAHAKAAAIRSRLAAASAGAAAKLSPPALPALLITSDQVVVHRGVILEKPESAAQARAFIRGYAHASARTCGAIVVTNLASGAVAAALDTATVFFREIPEASVEALIAEGDVFFCAGGLMVEHPLVAPHVERMEGGMDSIMGLSKALTQRLLIEAAGGEASAAPTEAA